MTQQNELREQMPKAPIIEGVPRHFRCTKQRDADHKFYREWFDQHFDEEAKRRGYVQLDEDQSLPLGTHISTHAGQAFAQGRQSLISAGWRKVKQ